MRVHDSSSHYWCMGLHRTVSFLKKLSIFKENKDAMKENGIIFRISALFPCPNEVSDPTVTLLYALSKLFQQYEETWFDAVS